MNSENNSIIEKEGILKIKAIVRNTKIQGAIISLGFWGILNIITWFFFGAEGRELLDRLSNPNFDIYFLVYYGLVLGIVMLIFCGVGAITKLTAIIILNGISLMVIGVINISGHFIAGEILRNYNYRLDGPPNIMWIIIGFAQIGWGIKELGSFRNIVFWKIPPYNPDDLVEFKTKLESFLKNDENPEEGIIKGSIPQNQTEYTGKLTEDVCVMVSSKLDDCFTIDKQDRDLELILNADDSLKIREKFRFKPLSLTAFKNWYNFSSQKNE